MPNFALLALVPTGTPTNRQALQSFGVNDDKDTPRALGQTECDTDGAAIMGREANAGKIDTVSAGSPVTALAANAKRAMLVLQNRSSGGVLKYAWGGAPTVWFELDPRESFTFTSKCPADELQVDAVAGDVEFSAVEW